MGVELTSINFLNIEKGLADLADDETMRQIYDLLSKFLDPYVPKREGILTHEKVNVTPEYLQYEGPYAHYLYEGIVYAYNVPIYENGVITGYKSFEDEKKHPTGKPLHYDPEKHELATHHWDKAAMEDKGDVFTADVKKILLKKLKGG